MKIKLNETKEKIPAEFLTSLMSKGWEEVSALKAEITSLEHDFAGSKPVAEALQDLLDAYLIMVGRLQNYLEGKKLISLPAEEPVNEALTEELVEDTVVNTEKIEVNVQPKVVEEDDFDMLADEFMDEPVQVVAVSKPAIKPTVKKVEVADKAPAEIDTDFEYFCDFDEPDPTEPRLTDADLYPEQ